MQKRIKLLVRKNLKMSEGKIAAQCVHAALSLNIKIMQDRYLDWPALNGMESVVVLQVSDAKFKNDIERVLSSGETFFIVQDAGFTEVPSGTQTVLAYLEDDPRANSKVIDGGIEG